MRQGHVNDGSDFAHLGFRRLWAECFLNKIQNFAFCVRILAQEVRAVCESVRREGPGRAAAAWPRRACHSIIHREIHLIATNSSVLTNSVIEDGLDERERLIARSNERLPQLLLGWAHLALVELFNNRHPPNSISNANRLTTKVQKERRAKSILSS